MMKRSTTWIAGVVLVMSVLFQPGCGGHSRPARFYVLDPAAGAEGTMQISDSGRNDFTIGIGPVLLPKYLKKSQIVTRTGSNEVQLAEYDRWAGRLEEDIGRVIAENLAHILKTDRVFAYPAMKTAGLDYQININVIRFDGRLGENLELIVRWAVSDSSGNNLYGLKTTQVSEPAGGGGYSDMVAAQSRALAAFSHDLAATIKKLAAD